jgi:hypothetical protein
MRVSDRVGQVWKVKGTRGNTFVVVGAPLPPADGVDEPWGHPIIFLDDMSRDEYPETPGDEWELWPHLIRL